MRREAKLLLNKALDSLILSVEVFNRPYDRGRQTATLILLDHAFEMLLKAAILHRGGRIRERRARQTIGFDACIRVGLSNGAIKFLGDEQALLLQSINGLRDAAQHHILDISEGQLYMQTQSGVTLFRDLLQSVFGRDLALELPERVLPVAVHAPNDLQTLFDSEIKEIRSLLRPGRRRHTEAMARLRPLAILDSAMRGEKGQPGRGELSRIKKAVASNRPWAEIFPGVASVQITTEGAGSKIELRLTKKDGEPVHLVPEGTPDASVVAIRRVSELGYYNLGLRQVAQHVGLTQPRALAVVKELRLQEDDEYFKIIRIGKQTHKRYSQKAIRKIEEELPNLDMTAVWEKHRPRPKRK